ncbi:MAG: hypothetical protein QOI49_516 [Verrucomicrobiota bacterium]
MNPEKRDRTIFVGAVILLVYTFIRALMPVDELPSSTLNALHIAQELGMFIGVVGLAPRILRSIPEGASRGGWIFLLVVGAMAGIGVFAIRLSGGSRVELSPRTSRTADSGLRHQLHEELLAFEGLSKKLAFTRWFQTFATQDEAQIRTLTRENLQEARALSGEMREHADRILKVFADATAQGVAHSTLSDEPAAARLATWQATRESYVATYDYLGLIEKHWDEWLADPFPTATSDSKPWQVEILRLMDVAATSARQASVQLQSKMPPSAAATELWKQLHDVVGLWSELNLKLVNMPWLKDSAHRRSLPRSALQEVRKMYQELLGYADRALRILAEAESKKLDVSKALDTPAFTRPDFWRAWQRTTTASAEKLAVVDQNWDEYVAHPIPDAESDLKPWQREVRRLDAVAAAASKEMEAILSPSASPSPPVAEVTGLTKEIRDLIESWNTAMEKSAATRWAKTDFKDPAQKKTLTRRDLEEAVELSRVGAGFEERIVKLLAQAKAQGIDVSAAVKDAVLLRPEYWQGFQDMDALRLKFRKLAGQHWDEWLTAPEAIDAKSKPWQREMKRLDDEMEAVRKRMKAFVESMQVAAAPSVPPTKPTPAPPAPSPPASTMSRLILKTRLLPAVADYHRALGRLQATRWVKSPDANSYHPQKITQADLHDANEKLGELIAAIDKLRADLEAATEPVPASEKEYWRIKRETSGVFQQLTRLLEDNWKEWHVSGIQPNTGEPKAWQKEAVRLQTEIDKLKQVDQTSILL